MMPTFNLVAPAHFRVDPVLKEGLAVDCIVHTQCEVRIGAHPDVAASLKGASPRRAVAGDRLSCAFVQRAELFGAHAGVS
jgi:hypothetical protein